ncbi:MAG: M4 family metallopeptidase [Myxococcota bacterium]
MRSMFTLLPIALAAGCQPTMIAPGDRVANQDLAKVALDWLDQNDALGGIDEVEVLSADLDELGMGHVRLQQLQNGVRVLGGQIVVHIDDAGDVAHLTEKLARDVRVDKVPSIDEDLAGDLANADGRRRVESRELQVVRLDGEDHLAWRVQLEGTDPAHPTRPVVYVDAHSGEPLIEFENLNTVKDRRTYSANNGTSLPGTLKRSEGSASIGDAALDAAHDNAGLTYDYYSTEQGRDSWDGAGATMVSTAHYSVAYDNAFWNGSQMVYGDGGTYFRPLSLALDVVGHEFSHAVTERTAGLIYSGESGGLNEATSDIMGATIESYSRGWTEDADTWMIGEDIAKPAIGDALRFMDNPPADGASIDDYADYYSGLDVHYSSGIANKAFYLMVQDPSLTIRDAADIWYRALTFYMTPSTTFAEARDASVQAATDLFGAGSDQVGAVSSAWNAVGLRSFEVFDTETNVSGTTGQDLLFQFDTPAGATALAFATTGGSGDADMYVRFGAAPTTTNYQCKSEGSTTVERCEIDPAQVGTYFVLIHAYSTFSGVTLTASAAGAFVPPESEVCDDGIDNDGDGDADCFDSECAADPACETSVEVCDDGVDNDGDGDADCFDAECAGEPSCDLLSGEAGAKLRFTYDTPPGATQLVFTISGGTGDADLYVRHGARATRKKYDCRPYLPGNEEQCVIDAPEAGTYHVMVFGFEAFDGVAYDVTAVLGSEVCDDGVDNDGDGAQDCADTECGSDASCPLSGAMGDELRFSFDTPPGATTMTFAISGGAGDADLYVRYGAAPDLTFYDCAPYLWGNEEVCTFTPAQAGTYHVMVHGYDAFDGVSLSVLSD